MVEEPGASPGAQPVWLSVAVAARQLGVTQQALRRRVARGTLESRREVAGNRSRLLVRVERSGEQSETPAVLNPEVAELREHLARVEERLAAAEAARDRAEGEVVFLRSELQRRRWPGLRRWWRRFVEGEG